MAGAWFSCAARYRPNQLVDFLLELNEQTPLT